jgi:hypothetical protein
VRWVGLQPNVVNVLFSCRQCNRKKACGWLERILDRRLGFPSQTFPSTPGPHELQTEWCRLRDGAFRLLETSTFYRQFLRGITTSFTTSFASASCRFCCAQLDGHFYNPFSLTFAPCATICHNRQTGFWQYRRYPVTGLSLQILVRFSFLQPDVPLYWLI